MTAEATRALDALDRKQVEHLHHLVIATALETVIESLPIHAFDTTGEMKAYLLGRLEAAKSHAQEQFPIGAAA